MLGKSPGWEGRALQGGEVPGLGAEGLLLSSVLTQKGLPLGYAWGTL